jgi:hypothetical protein
MFDRVEAFNQRPVYRLVAEAIASDQGAGGVWTALRVGRLGFATPGRYAGMVQGCGHLLADTHMVEGKRVRQLATQTFRVQRIQRLVAVHSHYGPPMDMLGTHEQLPAEPGSTRVLFLVHCSLGS